MKKKIALLILLVFALTFAFAACKNPDPTPIVPRWSKDGESYEYVISLADFATGENPTTHFEPHLKNNDPYFKDFDIRTGEPINSLDQIRPLSVSGTFTLTISPQSDEDDLHQTLTTEQVLNATYNSADVTIPLEELQEKGLFVGTDAENKTITLTSTTTTMVEFERTKKQTPKKSSTEVNGFYIGKENQEISSYKISTEYDYSNKKRTVAKIKMTSGDETKVDESVTIKRYTAGTFIDSNQLILYARSLDKTSTSFQDSPNVAVYDPFYQKMQTTTFVWTPEANAVLTNPKTEEELFTKVPNLGIVVGGLPFMMMTSAPSFLDENQEGPDSEFFGVANYAKHTPLRFRVGYLAFELKAGNGYDTLWSALNGTLSAE